jgi:hypothetical protein
MTRPPRNPALPTNADEPNPRLMKPAEYRDGEQYREHKRYVREAEPRSSEKWTRTLPSPRESKKPS